MPVKTGMVLKELKQFRKGAPNKYNNKLKVTKFEEANAAGINSVTFRGIVTGEFVRQDEDGGRAKRQKYRVAVQFFEVKFSKAKSKFFSIPAKIGKALQFRQVPNLKENTVKLKCSCPDFRFRFEKELFDNKGLIGRFRKYTRKTPPPPEGHPFANPDELMGYCKHVHSFLVRLKDNKQIKG